MKDSDLSFNPFFVAAKQAKILIIKYYAIFLFWQNLRQMQLKM